MSALIAASTASSSTPDKISLYGMSRTGLEEFLSGLGAKPCHAGSILRKIYHEGVRDIADFGACGPSLRRRLSEATCMSMPSFSSSHVAGDGVRKWLLQFSDGAGVETVFIPESRRGTLCISSQAGCALRCSFCATGAAGFQRDLSAAEIIAQVWRAHEALEAFRPGSGRCISNIVLMGMGEPLLNYSAVAAAIDVLHDDLGFGIPGRRITLSTAGVVPKIRELARHPASPALAISLHAPRDELRDELVPLNRKYPLAALLDACRDYLAILAHPRRVITFEYTLIRDVNDSPALARETLQLLAGIPCKVNLIPFNPFPGSSLRRPDTAVLRRFQEILQAGGLRTLVRATRGDEVSAACGQLQGRVAARGHSARLAVS